MANQDAVAVCVPLGDWPHSPVHGLSLPGTFMVTSATYYKQKYFNTPDLLTLLTNLLLNLAEAHGWILQAWAVFPNHYYFVGESPHPATLRQFIGKLHSISAHRLSFEQNAPTRRIWFQYWDSQITFQRSFLARLDYVHQNPVRHKIIRNAALYQWCSARWFEQSTSPAFAKTVNSFPVDQLRIPDDSGDLLVS